MLLRKDSQGGWFFLRILTAVVICSRYGEQRESPKERGLSRNGHGNGDPEGFLYNVHGLTKARYSPHGVCGEP